MELEYLNRLAPEAAESAATPAARPSSAHDASLQQLQHALGNRSLARLAQDENATGAAGLEAAREAVGDGGVPLPPSERAYFEPLFGHDFGGVRLHTGTHAARSAAAFGARAYALGPDVAFAHGHYAPGTDAGRRLLAHELAHVVQQRQPGAAGDAEQRADAAAAEVSTGRAVTPQSLGGVATGLHADNGTTILPGGAGRKPSDLSFKLPPLKISRWLFTYLSTHNMLSPQLKQMLLDGEIEVDWTEPAPSFPLSPEAAGQHGVKLWRELDPLRRRLLGAGMTLNAPTMDFNLRPGYDPLRGYEEPRKYPAIPWSPPTPDKEPSFFEKHFEWKGLSEGLDIKVPYLNPNISLSGLTVDVLKAGRFSMKFVKNLGKNFELKMAYRDWRLSGSVDTDGKWLLKLTYPTDAPMPHASALNDIFQQGERALEEAVRTLAETLPRSDFGTLKDKVSVLVDPLMNAADAGMNLKEAKGGVNVSLVIGAGPAPGKLPEEVLRGIESPAATQQGVYGGINLTFIF